MISRAVLLLIAAYFSATVGYALFNADAYATDIYRVIRYIIGPGVLALGASLAALLLRSDTRVLTAVYASAVLGSLFLAEGYLTFKSLQGSTGLYANVLDNGAAAERFSSGLPPASTLKGLNQEIGVQKPEDVLLGNLPNSEVLLCRKGGEAVSYRADRYGFRNDDAIYDKPVEAMLLGDSFAEGICLHEGEHLADKLLGRGLNIVNTGTRGAGPLLELAILERFGPIIRPPQTVMLVFGGNDAANLARALDLPWLVSAVEGAFAGTPPLPEQVQLDRARAKLEQWWSIREAPLREMLGDNSVFRNFLALQRISLALGLFFPAEPSIPPLYDDIIVRAAKTVATWNGELTLVYLPPKDQFVGRMSFPEAYDAFPGVVQAAAKSAGAGFLDLSPAFWAHPSPPALYAPDAHLSEEGADFAATMILEALTRDLELTQHGL